MRRRARGLADIGVPSGSSRPGHQPQERRQHTDRDGNTNEPSPATARLVDCYGCLFGIAHASLSFPTVRLHLIVPATPGRAEAITSARHGFAYSSLFVKYR